MPTITSHIKNVHNSATDLAEKDTQMLNISNKNSIFYWIGIIQEMQLLL